VGWLGPIEIEIRIYLGSPQNTKKKTKKKRKKKPKNKKKKPQTLQSLKIKEGL